MGETSSNLFRYYYLFTAKGLQDFILRGDKLRLMVGGSSLIEGLASVFFKRILKEMKLEEDVDYHWVSTAAGSARILFRNEETVLNLIRIIPPALSIHAPNLEFSQTYKKINDSLAHTMQQADYEVQKRRNLLFPSFPVAGPLVDRCPRSGFPSVGKIRFGDDTEQADAGMIAKEKALEQSGELLASKVLPEQERLSLKQLKLPTDFSQMTRKERENIAIVHIDGNGLGALVIKLFDQLSNEDDSIVTETYNNFSKAIQTATEEAFQKAIGPLVKQSHDNNDDYYSFRPLICAGDDVTAVFRAADAFTFVGDFLSEFEQTSAKELRNLNINNLPQSLTSCAGIVYLKHNFPFSQAYDLCESLCKFSKEQTRRKASAVTFWRLTTTHAEEFGSILDRELSFKSKDSNEDLALTMMPYVLKNDQEEFGTIEELLKLKEAVKAMPRGSLRQVLSEMTRSRTRTERNFERIRQINKTQNKNNSSATTVFSELERALSNITGSEGDKVLFQVRNGQAKTPLHDAIELLSAERG